MTDLLSRIAGAPITWGVDGSTGWGHILHRDRVMAEMKSTGLGATELGPDGFLPTDPDEMGDYLAGYGLHIVGGFVPAVLYRPDIIEAELAYVDRASRQLAAAGSKVMVLGPASHLAGYDTSIDLDDDQWAEFGANLARLEALVAENGLVTALHPHWGMAIERGHHVERLLESCDVGLCLDTGHLFLAGTDPVDIARLATSRIHHVHLKDVDGSMAEQVRSGGLGFRQAVIDGMFRPLGGGDADIAGVIATLERSGYSGWYVLEQDASLAAEPGQGEGPQADVIASVDYLGEERVPYDVECVLDAAAMLGECPVWDGDDQRLYWADIDGRAVHRFDPVSGGDESRSLPGRPGSFALTTGGRLLIAMETTLAWLDWESGEVTHWLDLERPEGGNRLNDGRADPAGRFWVGSMFPDTTQRRSTGMLHRVEPDGSADTIRTEISVSNGLAFSPDGTTMYFADSPRATIWAYDYDVATGEASAERVFFEFAELSGFPDGGCVDADGCYWTACVYGWSIARITPEGHLDQVVPLPVQKPTMCAFGGADLDVLYVTSIGAGGSGTPAPDQPLAGGLFALHVDVGGIAEPGSPDSRPDHGTFQRQDL